MPLNPKVKLVEKYKGKSAQDIQDEIFRQMSAGKKMKLASGFFRLAKSLNPAAFNYGTRRIIAKNSKNP